jgi:hypothetical protein
MCQTSATYFQLKSEIVQKFKKLRSESFKIYERLRSLKLSQALQSTVRARDNGSHPFHRFGSESFKLCERLGSFFWATSHLFERRGLGKADETSGSQRSNDATPSNCFNMEPLVRKFWHINLLLPEPRLDLRSVAKLGQLGASSISCFADQSLSSHNDCLQNSFAITLFYLPLFEFYSRSLS